MRSISLRTAFALVMLALTGSQPVAAQGTLRVAMTLADIPLTDGAPDQGTEGVRFSGYTIFDPLVNWDLSQADHPADITPGLATEWAPRADDPTRWIFKLRQGVRFHDGSPFNADAVIFSLERAMNSAHPAYDASAHRQLALFIPAVKAWRKIDDFTVEIETKGVASQLPYQLTRFLVISPAQYEAVGRDWAAFRRNPSGTGPWRMETLVPRQRMELVRNADYWNKERIPKVDRLVLLPIPEVSARTAALLAHRVDWAESPSPDTVPRLREAGFTISTNAIPHMWPYTLSVLPDSPLHDIRVRKALNLAIDREGLVRVLNGLAVPAVGSVPPDHPWFGNPSFHIRYDPAEAKRLLAEAGYGPDHHLRLKFAISTAGSGQMYPLVMNEFVQENFRQVGVDLELEVLEWEALRARRRDGAQGASNRGIDAINNSYGTNDPYNALQRYVHPSEIPPAGSNWGNINDPILTSLTEQVDAEFDRSRQDALLAKLHERMVDQAYFVWVVHDVGSRALSSRVQGHVHAKSWFVDFSPISLR
jgi:peptide/nickel transport system substrate-binding protein